MGRTSYSFIKSKIIFLDSVFFLCVCYLSNNVMTDLDDKNAEVEIYCILQRQQLRKTVGLLQR